MMVGLVVTRTQQQRRSVGVPSVVKRLLGHTIAIASPLPKTKNSGIFMAWELLLLLLPKLLFLISALCG
jgi:hypothetical protein